MNTKCVAPECVNGLVYGVETCRACEGTGIAGMKIYEVREQMPHRPIASFKSLFEAQSFLAHSEQRFVLPIIVSFTTHPKGRR